MLLWLSGEPQHQRAWAVGGRGERAIGTRLEARTAEGPAILLHDRRRPGSRSNIDHIAIAPTGVYVIDAKAHKGNVGVEKPLLGSAKLTINGHDQTKLIDGLDGQVVAVRDALARGGHGDVPVHGALCFTNANLPLLRTQRFRGHLLLYGRALAKRLNAEGPLDAARIEAIAGDLATRFPAA